MYAVIRNGVAVDSVYARDAKDAARIIKNRGYSISAVLDGYERYDGAFVVS